jgi:hypothetical protein
VNVLCEYNTEIHLYLSCERHLSLRTTGPFSFLERALMNENGRPRPVFLNGLSFSLAWAKGNEVQPLHAMRPSEWIARCERQGGLGRNRSPALAPAPPLCYVHFLPSDPTFTPRSREAHAFRWSSRHLSVTSQ